MYSSFEWVTNKEELNLSALNPDELFSEVGPSLIQEKLDEWLAEHDNTTNGKNNEELKLLLRTIKTECAYSAKLVGLRGRSEMVGLLVCQALTLNQK